MANPSFARAERVRAAIKQVLAVEVEQLKDPGVAFMTVTDVTLTPDLRHATAYYTVYGGESERAATSEALVRASPRLRSAVARNVRLRHAPTLEFVEDPVPAEAERIERLIREIRRPEGGSAADDPR